MSETQGVIKKNGAINPNRENLSFVKNLSHSTCDCGTSVFTRELLLPTCARTYCAAGGSQHPVQWEQHWARVCSWGRQLAILYKEDYCEKCRYLSLKLLVINQYSHCFCHSNACFPQCVCICVPIVICVSPLKP